MAEQITSSAPDANGKYYFLLRRLHSLSGIIPIGVFLLFHLTANSTILAGGDKFQFMVNQIHMLAHAGLLIPVEMALIFIPLAFHAILGIVITLTAAPNPGAYRYGPNIRYTLQRTTGIIAFLFIIFHVWQMHWLGAWFGGGVFVPHDPDVPFRASSSAAEAIQASGWYPVIYVIGVLAAVFHLANGIWTALITWGITIGPRSQRLAGYVCTAFGIALGLVGVSAVAGFTTYDPKTDAPSQATTQAPSEHASTPAVEAEH